MKTALLTRVFPRVAAALTAARTRPNFGKLSAPGPVAQLVVAGIDAGASALGVFVVELREPFVLVPRWVTCPGTLAPGWCKDGKVFVSAAAAEGPAISLLRVRRPAWVEAASAGAARRVVRGQIDATPADARGPIDVLEINARGARWVERDAASTCAAR